MPQQGVKASADIGRNIRAARRAQGLTQERLAAQMQVLGCDVSRAALAKVEAGLRHVSLAELRAFRAALRVSWEDLLGA